MKEAAVPLNLDHGQRQAPETQFLFFSASAKNTCSSPWIFVLSLRKQYVCESDLQQQK